MGHYTHENYTLMKQVFNRVILLEKAMLEGTVPLCEDDTWIAQQTHEAAREGTVPLCEDNI